MIKRKLKRKHKSRRWTIKTSKLEKRFEMLLKELDIKYSTQKQICSKFYDFFLPEHKILIETDGNYWHGNPAKYAGRMSQMQKKNKINDLIKTNLAEAAGYTLLRFWEIDINTNPISVRNKLLEAVGRL